MLIIAESSIGAFLLSYYSSFYLVIIICISFYFCTCWVPIISVLNLTIFSWYSNPLLIRGRWTRILPRGVLGMRCPSCCSCGVIESSTILFHKRVVLVHSDIIYVINILYSWHLVICEHFWSMCVEQMILGTHAMSTWFCLQNRVCFCNRNPQPIFTSTQWTSVAILPPCVCFEKLCSWCMVRW
jgi:hypothetical protein